MTIDRAMLDAIGACGDAIVTRAVDWCATQSGSHNADGLAQMLDQLAAAFAPLGATAARVPLADRVEIAADGEERSHPGGTALHLRVRPEATRRVLLTGHYDTVYPSDSPFREVTPRGDGTLNGPGIADMKGGLSVMLAALTAWEARLDAAAIGWDVLLSPDEEIGSPGSAPHLARLARQAQLGLTYEPALAGGSLASARMGSGNFHLVVRGRATHVGRDFAGGRNAVVAAAGLVAALDALNAGRDGVRLNIARIDGGGPLNMVPDVAVIRFNIRVGDAADATWTQTEIARIAAAPLRDGLTAQLYGGLTRPPKPFGPDQQALFAAVADLGATLGQTIRWQPSGGVCEGNNLHAAGLPSIDTLGVCGGDIHSPREFAWPASFVERAQLSALILAAFARADLPGA
ncbi:hydrolase [Sphingomonas sp.]|uniref:hydrolase n=1 Tax=Sphingomonas sp. TaxID=28214 RepID=UPI003CC66961